MRMVEAEIIAVVGGVVRVIVGIGVGRIVIAVVTMFRPEVVGPDVDQRVVVWVFIDLAIDHVCYLAVNG